MKTKVIKQTNKWLSVSEKPCITKEEKLEKVKLIKSLLEEELTELEEAIQNDDIFEEYNAIADSYVVLSNLPFYLDLNLKVLNKELSLVYKSNCTKYCQAIEEAEQTKIAYANGTHPNKLGKSIEVNIHQNTINGKTIYYLKTKEGKIMKSINFKDVNEI